MRIMALDVGDKTIGVAVTDQMGWTAQAVTTIRRSGLNKDIEALSKLVGDYGVETLVVGLPLRGDGEMGIQAKKVEGFANVVKDVLSRKYTALKFEMWDESMTTAEAHELFGKAGLTNKRRRKLVDKMAAVFILESYMRGKGIV